MAENANESLLNAILDADRGTAASILEAELRSLGPVRALNEVLEPTLDRIGALWEGKKDISLAQAYAAGKISEEFLSKVALVDSGAGAVPMGVAVIGNIEDDFHSLGRKMLGIFLKAAGWAVHDAGNDATAQRFVEAALESGASVIGVSAMMYSTAKNISKLRDELDRLGLSGRIKLAVGGAIFRLRPELVREVGGDGSVGNAMLAPELFKRLRNEAEPSR
jgi:methylmalonyl-CoA mutase cobalamin-binding domain/chain